MRRFLSLIATAGLVIFATSGVHAQNRNFGARTFTMDDGAGHFYTMQAPAGMTGNVTYNMPLPPPGNPPAGFVGIGGAAGQTLYWNSVNGDWEASSVIQNNVNGNGTGVTITAPITATNLATAGVVHNAAGGLLTTGPVNLASNGAGGDVTGVLAIANGGTGSNVQNFVDLTTNQTVGGNKSFTGSTTANTFASSGATITGGAITGTPISGSTGSFTTLASSGASTVGTGASLTNSFGNGTNATNNIGNGGGTTTNAVGNNAASNQFGISAGANVFGNAATQNNFGNAAGLNQFGSTGSGSNNFGQNTTGTNNFGSTVGTNNHVGVSNFQGNITFNANSITGTGPITGGAGTFTALTASTSETFSNLNTAGVVHNSNTGLLSTGPINLASNGAGGDVSGILAVANGGTGSNTQNFVDLTTAQTVAGNKTFTGTTTANTFASSGATITGGAISGTPISGSTGSFTTLSATGATNINTSGGATTSIGTGGTGPVNIGNNSGGSIFTGALTSNGAANIGNQLTDAENPGSIIWQQNGGGYAAGINNIGAAANADGLIVKTLGTASTNRVFTVNSGAAASGTDRFTVFGDGSISAPGVLTSGGINMNNNAITNVAAPVNPGDAANKSYVDNSTNTAVNGTINTIPKFTAAHVLGNSALSDNAGTLSYTGNTIQQPTGGQSLGIVTAPFGGGSSGAITIKTGDIAGSGNPGAVNIIGGNSNGFGGAATAGSVNIAGGTSNNGNGGNVTIAGGGPGFGGLSGGGSVFISGGAAPAGNGGVTISTTNTNIAINPGVSNQITSNGGISIAGTSLIGNVGTTSVGIGGTGASTVNVNPSGTGTTTIGSGANNLQVNSTTGINNTIANPTVIGMNNAAATVAITGGTTWSVTAGGAATFATVAGNGAALTNVNAVKINGNTVPANAVGQLTNDGAGNLSWATAGSAVQFTRVAVTAPTTYNAATTDNFIGVNTTAAGNTIINLPTAAAAGSGHTIIIKDEALKVDAAHTVTINATGGNTLEDPATETFGGSAVMNGTFSPGVCFGYYSDGTSKWIIWTLNP